MHREDDPRDDPDGALLEEAVEEAGIETRQLDDPEEDEHPVDDRRRAADGRQVDHQERRHAQGERREGEDRPDDQADEDPEDVRVDAQPVHQADAEGVAQRATQDDDRGVVPEERDHREEQAEPEPDDPRQDRREEALAEDLLAPLRARGQAEQECPQGQQDREELEAVGRPGCTDHDGQQADDDAFDGHPNPPLWAPAAGHVRMNGADAGTIPAAPAPTSPLRA